MIHQSLKDTLVTRITRICGECTIYLFGSHAYGNPTSSSDLDIAVVVDRVESKIAKAAELWDALKDIAFPKDIMVVSRTEFDFYKTEAGSIFKTISQRGVVLNEH